MKVTSETLPDRQVKLQIEVEPERQAVAMEQAYKRLAPRIRIAGFRPGKAPRRLIEQQLGHHRLLDEAMEILLPDVYREAVEEQAINPVAQPAVELVSHEPLVFTATVPLQPEVDLGDYQALRVPRPAPEVTDAQVDEALDELRQRYGTIEPVDRPAQKGDVIRGNIEAKTGDDTVFREDEIEYRLTDESLSSLPGLADAIVGLAKGADVERTHDVPADFGSQRLAGKTVTYHLVVAEVKEEKLADLSDDFAKTVGEGFDSLDALKTRLRDDIKKAQDDAALRAYEADILEKLVETATLEYPWVLVDQEIHRILDDQSRLDPRDPQAVDLYIKRMGKSEDEVHEEVRPDAEERLRRSLVLSRFAEAENISVDDSDVDAELDKMAESAGEQASAIRNIFDTANGRETIKRTLLTRKTFDRLVEIAGAEAAPAAPKRRAAAKTAKTAEEAPPETPDAEAPPETPDAEAPPAKPKARRSGPRQTE